MIEIGWFTDERDDRVEGIGCAGSGPSYANEIGIRSFSFPGQDLSIVWEDFAYGRF